MFDVCLRGRSRKRPLEDFWVRLDNIIVVIDKTLCGRFRVVEVDVLKGEGDIVNLSQISLSF